MRYLMIGQMGKDSMEMSESNAGRDNRTNYKERKPDPSEIENFE